MEDESLHTSPSSSSSSSSSSSAQPFEEAEDREENHHQEPEPEPEQEQQHQDPHRGLSFVTNATSPLAESPGPSEDTWSCFIVMLTFWFFASVTLILGFYGPSDLQFGPNCSHLLQVNSFFVHEIKVQELSGPKYDVILYGFRTPPLLDVETTWSETHKASLSYKFHKEWVYYLNEGSEVNITYNVKSENSYPLFLVIAQGMESFLEWVEDPSYPNLTLSWNVIYGSGRIHQKIFKSSYYYIAVGNLNPEEVKVKLDFGIRAFLYNTSEANYNCSVAHSGCGFKLNFLGASAAVLTSPHPEKSRTSKDWHAKLSYEPRWLSYLAGSGIMTILILLLLRLCDKFQSPRQTGVGQAGERAPLLTRKEDDTSSWGSSYESVSHDEDEVDAMGSLETNSVKGDSSHPRRLCVICFDATRDCFFLPCGHCASCFTCGIRIVEEAGTCPICRRKLKKVRKIFTV